MLYRLVCISGMLASMAALGAAVGLTGAMLARLP